MGVYGIYMPYTLLGGATMVMHVNLSPEMETFIKGKVEAGFYGNATEVIRDAVRRMQDEDTRLAALRMALQKGEDSLRENGAIPYSRALLEAVTERAIATAERTGPTDPDVAP